MKQYPDMLLELVLTDVIAAKEVIRACLNYMTDEQIKDMCEHYEYVEWMNYRDEPHTTERTW